MEEAEGDYQKGLSFNKIHYKCLVGLFDLLMEQKNYTKAYAVVKKVAQYFPANPQRLATVLRLAIMTGSYEDIERYYQAFTGIDQRNDMLIRYVCAALVVCGKYYLKQKHGRRALELFEKAGIASAGRPRVLREIISTLLEFDLASEAQKYLSRFPRQTADDVDFHACDLMITLNLSGPSVTIEKGRKLLSQGTEDPDIYRSLIQASFQANLIDAAQSLIQTAKQKYPKQESRFDLKPSEPPKENA